MNRCQQFESDEYRIDSTIYSEQYDHIPAGPASTRFVDQVIQNTFFINTIQLIVFFFAILKAS